MTSAQGSQNGATPVDSPRIKRLRRELIKAIPRIPNDRMSLQHMQQKHLADLLIDYVSWRSRFVGTRPRRISVDPAAEADARWTIHKASINAFLNNVQKGNDLTPHLSLEPSTRGYAPAARARGASTEDKWSDKDFLLNVMGYHHFHLGMIVPGKGHADRTDDLIFARVDRDSFEVIAIFDHEVFEPSSPERMRLWSVHDQALNQGAPAGSVLVSSIIATSGHPLHVVRHAQLCAQRIRELDSKLDDPTFVTNLYQPVEEAPAKPKPHWQFLHLDLAIFDAAKPGYLIVQKGWN